VRLRAASAVLKAHGPDEDDGWYSKMREGLALGLLGRLAEAVDLLEGVLPELVTRKLPAWNIAQAKWGLAGSRSALRREPARVSLLLKDVLALADRR
jgi:hypothetical protein